jgi:hypothetical protein
MRTPLVYALIAALGFSAVSCTTHYDHYGYPRQTVDPAAATAGVAAAGLIGYAIGNNRSRTRHYDHRYADHRTHYYAPRRHYRRY